VVVVNNRDYKEKRDRWLGFYTITNYSDIPYYNSNCTREYLENLNELDYTKLKI
jgi:hypothetical protein